MKAKANQRCWEVFDLLITGQITSLAELCLGQK